MVGLLPILDGKVLYVDVAGALSGLVSVDHLDGGFVVFTDRSWAFFG
jgi:hypothetical protein